MFSGAISNKQVGIHYRSGSPGYDVVFTGNQTKLMGAGFPLPKTPGQPWPERPPPYCQRATQF